jgi:2-deoxy-D-gluconate 3-dehydrogenase
MSSLFSLDGHTALVTGGTRGIGQSMAIALAEAGADIILLQVHKQKLTCPKSLTKRQQQAQLTTTTT